MEQRELRAEINRLLVIVVTAAVLMAMIALIIWSLGDEKRGREEAYQTSLRTNQLQQDADVLLSSEGRLP